MASVSAVCLGHSLSPAEQVHVKANLVQLGLGEKFDKISFWGKVMGNHADYTIARGDRLGKSVTHKYWASTDGGLSFAELPLVEPWMGQRCESIFSEFVGTPGHPYLEPKPEVDEEAEPEPETPEDEDNPPAPEQVLTELHRLHWTVMSIDKACAIVPIGALALSGTKDIGVNAYFKALTPHEAAKLSSYLHYRDPVLPHVLAKFRSVEFNNDSDFLDPISEDRQGSWAVRQTDSIRTSLRSLVWPGFEFTYDAQAQTYENAYFGTGIRQSDLTFLN